MTEKPIIFSGPMVRALLDRSKTQTRRVVKSHTPIAAVGCAADWNRSKAHPAMGNPAIVLLDKDARPFSIRLPYGKPGDRLWVREAWRTVREADDTPPRDMDAAYRLWYEAGAYADHHAHQLGYGKLRPSIYMPRWASRITLEITGVRVERLRDITVSDAICEGYDGSNPSPVDPSIEWFSNLWESINGPGSWDLNPWVWAIEFKRIEA